MDVRPPDLDSCLASEVAGKALRDMDPESLRDLLEIGQSELREDLVGRDQTIPALRMILNAKKPLAPQSLIGERLWP